MQKTSLFWIRNKRSAFTLIETIAVVILISLVMGVVVPRGAGALGLNLKGEAVRLSGFLQSAYNHAIFKHKRLRIQIDLDDHKIWAEGYVESMLEPLISENTDLEDVLLLFRKRAEDYRDLESDEERRAFLDQSFEKLDTRNLQTRRLRSGVRFKRLEFPGRKEIHESGIWSIDVSSSGVNPKVILVIQHDEKAMYTLVLPAVSGNVQIHKGDLGSEDV